jgi:DNA-binding response OmpR family regulator
MATVVLAIGDSTLRRLCQSTLDRAGHVTIPVARPLEVLDVAFRIQPDALLADGTSLGKEAVTAWGGWRPIVRIGLGMDHEKLAASLTLPVTGNQVLQTVEGMLGAAPAGSDGLALDAARRVARANAREVDLTRTEFQLLQALHAARGRQLSQDEALAAAWGPGDWSGNVGVLRAHVRNLRLKLAQVGLPNAVRSLRGKGYALDV